MLLWVLEAADVLQYFHTNALRRGADTQLYTVRTFIQIQHSYSRISSKHTFRTLQKNDLHAKYESYSNMYSRTYNVTLSQASFSVGYSQSGVHWHVGQHTAWSTMCLTATSTSVHTYNWTFTLACCWYRPGKGSSILCYMATYTQEFIRRESQWVSQWHLQLYIKPIVLWTIHVHDLNMISQLLK